MQKRLIISILTLLFLGADLFSQQYFFRRYSVEEGLPQASVYCLLQDSRGYIWMGTDGAGVARFDGMKSEVFSKVNGLSDNVVRSLFEDSKGNIWIGTDKGITVYNGFSFNVVGKDQGLNGTSVLKITEGSNGIIWAATNDGGLSGISYGDSVTVKSFTVDNGLLNNLIFDIYEAPDKKLWLAMGGGLSIIEFESDSLEIKEIYNPDLGNGLYNPIITTIEPGNGSEIWLGTYGKGVFIARPGKDAHEITLTPSKVNTTIADMVAWDICKMDNGVIWIATNDQGVIKLENGKLAGILNKESGLLSNQILDIMPDRDNNIWFASFGQGTMMYQDDKFMRYTVNDGIKGNIALDILFINNSDFYLATEEGLSLFRKEGSSIKRLSHYSSSAGLNSLGANTIAKKKDEIWIGTNNGINILKNSKISSFIGNNKLGNKNISTLLADSHNDVWIGTAGGYGRIFGDNLFFMTQDEGFINDEVQSIIEDKKGIIWMATMGGLVKLDGAAYTDYNEVEGLTSLKISALAEDTFGNIWIGTLDGGIFKLDIARDSLPISQIAAKNLLSSNKINSLQFIRDTLLAAGNDKGFDLLVLNKEQTVKAVIHYGINDGFTGGENSANSIETDSEGMAWIGTKNGLMKYNPFRDFDYSLKPETRITGVRLFFEDVDWKARKFETGRWSGLPLNLVLPHKDNHLTFVFTGFEYDDPGGLEFSYFLENQSKEWSPYIKEREVVFSGLTPGSYVFKVKAKNKYGITGNTAEYSFVIKPPFWQTPWFYMPALILLVFSVIMIIRIRERNLIKEKIRLEKIVEERTREVVMQKDEIARQRDVVTYQKKEITDSIHYAERIQRAVLPDDNLLRKEFSDYFVLFRPKDIVSGDFYWMSYKNDHVVFTAADCTGHGVPGAFMSMLGVSFLNKIVNELGLVKPSDILNSLRSNIITALKQEGTHDGAKDGMDIALCSFDLKNRKLMFAGANNPLFLIRKNGEGYELMETPADKMPIGYHSSMESFTNNEIDIVKGDTVYLFSDGFLDQFGGPDGRKFMKKRFKEMLLNNQAFDMPSQRTAYNNIIEEWINHPPPDPSLEALSGQIDDIIVIGVRF
ncbi:MAG TPA: two-component regulator propeller domain-containing protein [Bacteroidales bacterium]|nr:two-component regulator propeller domain-containing protein [Bacteroidales bacterium]